jgi:hypothetical protein
MERSNGTKGDIAEEELKVPKSSFVEILIPLRIVVLCVVLEVFFKLYELCVFVRRQTVKVKSFKKR